MACKTCRFEHGIIFVNFKDGDQPCCERLSWLQSDVALLMAEAIQLWTWHRFRHIPQHARRTG